MINMRSIKFIPESKNFSAYNSKVPDENNDNTLEYEVSDGGLQVEQQFSKIQSDELLLSLLSELDNRDKVVLLYQILKEVGYDLQHEDCAKTLSVSKNGYVVLVKNVKKKCIKILRSQKMI